MAPYWLTMKICSISFWTTVAFGGRFTFAQYCSIPGACICFLVLVVCAVAACFLRSRQHLDRVSFRLVIYALIFQYVLNYLLHTATNYINFSVLFGIAFAAAPDSPGVRCDFFAFISNVRSFDILLLVLTEFPILQVVLCYSTFFTTCIAINLQ